MLPGLQRRHFSLIIHPIHLIVYYHYLVFRFLFLLAFRLVRATSTMSSTPATTFLDSCDEQLRKFPTAIRDRADATVLKSRLSVHHGDFHVNEPLFIRILRHGRYWVSGERLVMAGYRGQLVLLAEYQILDHELSTNPHCRICHSRVPTLRQWMEHVVAGGCILLDPLPWYPGLASLPLLNTI